MAGQRPLGWYTGRDSPNTRHLVADFGAFEYDSDYDGDDLPFWLQVRKSDGAMAPHLMLPCTLDANDMRFARPQGYSHGDEFFEYLRDAFNVHHAEGEERPSMMSIGMHCRLLGRPGRMRALPRPAGKAMVSKTLRAESTNEQSKAGLTDCTPTEFAREPADQCRLQRQVRLPVHPGGARATWVGFAQGRDHRDH